MDKFMQAVSRFIRDEEGVTAIEYALIASLIAVVILVAVTNLGTAIKNVFFAICDALVTGECART